tara:strand:+ start:28 stop:1536 length:1509 start_codon:yes stop_codon:yes gene_type:complete
MPYGFEGTDTGYIFGSSWNIYNGQLPHRDFIYTRPAIPAYFHTIFLFISETYGYLLDRSFFYVQVFFYSYLGARLVTEHFNLPSKNSLYFLAALGALFSVHNYPPMGWNTIDGVFFCMIGLYLILKENSPIWLVIPGSLFLVLGVFSKQSFYFMPIFLFVYLLVRKDYRKVLWYSINGGLFVLIYIAFKYATDSLLPFWQQTFERTPASGLLSSGVKVYYLALKFNLLWIALGSAALYAVYRWLPGKVGFLLVHLGIAGFMVYIFLNDANSWTRIPYLFQLLLVACGLFCVVKLRTNSRYLLLLLLLALSWSAAISNGYRTPIHFSLPIIACIYLFFFPAEKEKLSPKLMLPILALYLGVFYLGHQTLYRDAERSELTYSMGEVFPQLAFIKSDKDTYQKYSQLKELATQYPNFTVLPSITLAHYLTGTVNPIGTDWPLDVEINNEGARLVNELEMSNTTVLMETSEFSEKELEGYEMKALIETHWKKIASHEYFDVYVPRQ